MKKIILSLILLSANFVWACQDKAHSQFDFWLGHWDVYSRDGRLVGENKIVKTHGGCVITEHYVSAQKYQGESLNIYDATRQVWHQTWVDNSGTLLQLDGGYNGQAMILEGTTIDKSGNKIQQRIKWTPQKDGTVHQHWQRTTDKGQHWEDVFYGVYIKKKSN
ncbi:MAG: hypothetical protein HWE13_05550 [Gammaproteobacteria bacterium]|nr:hypothetical protein [Gammaproteobacteria bacterium]NVK87567.1 hypothetical protein [Gammaproteobacteria bacterium]